MEWKAEQVVVVIETPFLSPESVGLCHVWNTPMTIPNYSSGQVPVRMDNSKIVLPE